MESTPHSNLAWSIIVSNRVAIIAAECFPQVYAKYEACSLNLWMYEQLHYFKSNLFGILGNKSNVSDFIAILERVYMLSSC